jgi:hypothetical protein
MAKDELIHKLNQLASIKRAPAVWREQNRARLMQQIEVNPAKPFTFSERLIYVLQKLRLALAPLPLAPVAAAVLLVLIGYSPFSVALAQSLPGSPLYPVKRSVEKIELSLRSSSDSQGLFYLTLAGRRLAEAQAVPEAVIQARLLRDYNVTLGFAQAGLETGLASADLAKAYDQAADVLEANLTNLPVTSANRQVYLAALDLTHKVSARALALLVSSHASEQNGVEPADVANRLTAEIAKVEAKLQGVAVKLKQSPKTAASPKVVIESKAKVVPVTEAQALAKENLTEAKELIAKNEFSLALQKMQESEELTAKSEAAVTEDETKASAAVPAEAATEPIAGEVKGESSSEGVPANTESGVPAPEAGGSDAATNSTVQINSVVQPKQ